MMKTIKTIALATILATSTVIAGKNVIPAVTPVTPVPFINPLPLYIGVGLLWSGTSFNCPCADDVQDSRLKDTTYGGILRVGYDFNEYIGIEGRMLKTFMSKTFAETTHYGLYLKPQYHVSDALNIYGLIGYGTTKIDCDYRDMPLYDDSGISFGAGLEYDLSSDTSEGAYARGFDGQGDQEKGWGLWVDYQNLLHDEGSNDIRANIVSAGVTYDF